MNSLPRNFQDAVSVTRALGYDYLWIDALCIVQDCPKDWEHEAGQMADVYKYASVTIVPVSAKSSHDGFLQPRRFRDARIPYIRPQDGLADGLILLRLDHRPWAHWGHDVDESWWRYRAWTLQEWLLSRRTLHFATQRIYHACGNPLDVKTEGDQLPPGCPPLNTDFDAEDFEDIVSADGTDCSTDSESVGQQSPCHQAPDEVFLTVNNDISDYPSTVSERANSSDIETSSDTETSESSLMRRHLRTYGDSPFGAWHVVVSDYTKRSLTVSEDKLPAIEGLAREMHSKCPRRLGRYFAGIWENDLARGLLWQPVRNDAGLRVGTESFSWPPEGPTPDPQKRYLGDPRSTILKLSVTLPKRYRAPSWSWASLDASVHWLGPWRSWTEYTQGVIEILEGSFQFEGDSIYGKLTDGHLTLMAVYLEVSTSCLTLKTTPGQQIRSASQDVDGESHWTGKSSDLVYLLDEAGPFAEANFDFMSDTPEKVYALKLTHGLPPHAMEYLPSGLLLQESGRRPGAYERLGTFGILEEGHLRAFADVRPRPITLV